MPHLTAIVKGRVQGVGYRYFVYDIAQQLGLKGFVRNLRSGDVEVQAEGTEEALQKLIKALWRGPAFAQVIDVQTQISANEKGFTEFQITF
ncbi:MAG: acylphosphatase [Candidatus Sumerlaeia bacterium]|nr:acylphosphatase [Candidatus Sumerlaeia bacterium]